MADGVWWECDAGAEGNAELARRTKRASAKNKRVWRSKIKKKSKAHIICATAASDADVLANPMLMSRRAQSAKATAAPRRDEKSLGRAAVAGQTE